MMTMMLRFSMLQHAIRVYDHLNVVPCPADTLAYVYQLCDKSAWMFP